MNHSYCLEVEDPGEKEKCDEFFRVHVYIEIACNGMRLLCSASLLCWLIYKKLFSELPLLARITAIAYVIQSLMWAIDDIWKNLGDFNTDIFDIIGEFIFNQVHWIFTA